jgi:hypothetical protein
MQFALPSNLQTELLVYDPKLKALAKQANKPAAKKPTYPLGKIPCLIPTHIVREADQQDAIAQINQRPAPQRYQVFTTPVDVATPQARLKVIAILYHYEQVWYAAWLPSKQEKDQYVYGHAYAFKNTAATHKTAPNWIWNSKDDCVVHDIGRGSQLFVYTNTATLEDIRGKDYDSWRSYPWRAGNLYCQKGYEIRDRVVTEFDNSLREDLPTWEDSRGLFDRIRCKNIFDAANIPSMMSKHLDESQGLTVDNFIAASFAFKEEHCYSSMTYSVVTKIHHIVTKPAIKKLLQAELNRSVDAYNDPNNKQQQPIRQGFATFVQILNSIEWIDSIWPDCPIDYYQTYFKELKYLRLTEVRVRSTFAQDMSLHNWLRQHMPVGSLFTILRKYLDKQLTEYNGRWVDSDVGYQRQRFGELNDTFSMMLKILDAGKTLEPPKRWRLTEFHDYVQSEAWKIENPKESLRQDLFPEPIKVTRLDKVWTFFQPVDTHQLSMWGQAVRNCVGSASHYADDIKKRKHFIVLCMIDNKPTFTIQLVVDQGMMSVKQIAGVGNKSLDSWERDAYTEAFREVLQLRESELSSKS